MRHWTLLALIALVFLGALYYISFGRFHNKIEPRITIKYQPTPTISSQLLDTNPDGNNQKLAEKTGGTCSAFTKKVDVHESYIKNTSEDCGAINDNDALVAESESKNLFNCLAANIKPGSCANSKAFIKLQGFEGGAEIFVETKECQITTHQWSTTSPQCGYSEKTCDRLSSDFPFHICAE